MTQKSYLEFGELLANFNESQMQLSPEVIGETAVVVVNAQIGGTNLAHAQLLLLVTARRHRISVLLFGLQFLLSELVDLRTAQSSGELQN